MIVIDHIKKTYNGKCILDVPQISLEEGKICAIIGANGSGKSTMAKIISGIILSDGRQSVISNKNIQVGYLPQKSYGFSMSTKRNLLLAADNKSKASELMNALDIEYLERNNASRLSGGEMQKMALARIMMKPFDLLILDEPTASMDMESTIKAENLIKKYCLDMNCAILLITHSIKQAERVSSRTVFLCNGKIVEDNSTQLLLHHPLESATIKFLEFQGT